MNPFMLNLDKIEAGIPRVSGDEPFSGSVTVRIPSYSPRERG